jgi:plastocyanin
MDGSSEGTRTVEVGPGGRYVFVPGTDEPLEITTGTTVEWVWRSDLHNVVVDSQPADASWEGTPGGAGKTYNTGYTYTHTFEIPGEYHYWCEPHRSLGMDADVVVTGP